MDHLYAALFSLLWSYNQPRLSKTAIFWASDAFPKTFQGAPQTLCPHFYNASCIPAPINVKLNVNEGVAFPLKITPVLNGFITTGQLWEPSKLLERLRFPRWSQRKEN